jgi:peptidyl-prolyl cis-trans isomerase B (cyclophilin B)
MVVGGTGRQGGIVASNKNAARQNRERLRRYTARQTVHARQVRRRRRDNIVAVAGVIVVAAAAALTQAFYFAAGPGAASAPAPSPSASVSARAEANVGDIPSPASAEDRTWTGQLELNDVTMGISLDGAKAPQAVAVFLQEVRSGYFTGKTCHRLTDSGALLIQCGSVDGSGAADPSFRFGPIENAPADGRYPAGTIAMARAADQPYSQGHQFFIMYGDGALPTDSAGGYTVFGHVTSGLDEFVAQIASAGVIPGGPGGDHDGSPRVPTTITKVTIE